MFVKLLIFDGIYNVYTLSVGVVFEIFNCFAKIYKKSKMLR